MSKTTPKTEAEPSKYRKRNLRKQVDRDEFGDELAKDMQAALDRGDWEDYKRIKEILFRTT